MPPWPPRSEPASFAPASRFSIDSKRSPSGAATADETERDRFTDRQVVGLVEGDERDEDGRDRAEDEALHVLPGEVFGAILCRPRRRPPT